jgi:hypothetical protein
MSVVETMARLDLSFREAHETNGLNVANIYCKKHVDTILDGSPQEQRLRQAAMTPSPCGVSMLKCRGNLYRGRTVRSSNSLVINKKEQSVFQDRIAESGPEFVET